MRAHLAVRIVDDAFVDPLLQHFEVRSASLDRHGRVMMHLARSKKLVNCTYRLREKKTQLLTLGVTNVTGGFLVQKTENRPSDTFALSTEEEQH